MASTYNDIQNRTAGGKNTLSWSNTQARQAAFPLEKYSIFPDLATAQDYANGQGEYANLAYEGQVITVTEDGKQVAYIIDNNAENKLRKVGGTADISDITPSDIGAADKNHTHSMSDIDGLSEKLEDIDQLQSDLTTKAAKEHSHQISQITGLEARLTNIENSSGSGEGGTFLAYTVNGQGPDSTGNFQIGLGLEAGQIAAAAQQHTHDIQDINGLQSALDNKSDVDHSHTMVTGINVNNNVLNGEVKLVGERNVEIKQDENSINIGITPYTSDTTRTIQDSNSSSVNYKVFVGTQQEWDDFKQNVNNGEHYIVFLRS